MKKAKSTVKALKNAHTPNTKLGMGDYYGSGIRNPVGKVIEGLGVKEMSKKQLSTPPRSLA